MTSRVSAQSPAEFCVGVERHPRSDEQACGPDMREQFLQSPVSTAAKLESKRLDPWWKTAFSPYWSTSNIFPRTHFFFANESYKEKGGFPRTTWGSLPPMAFSLCRIFFHLLACFWGFPVWFLWCGCHYEAHCGGRRHPCHAHNNPECIFKSICVPVGTLKI